MPKKNWDHYYSSIQGDIKTYIGELVTHRKFIETITDCNPRTVLEVGCGTGRTSIFLSHLGVSTTALDRDAGVIETAKRMNAALNGAVEFVEGNAFELPFEDSSFDVAFHQGVLEHFNDEQIVQIINEQLRIARTVVFSVPSNHYPQKDFGDERLLSKKSWEKILSPFKIIKSSNYSRSHLRPWWLLGFPCKMKVMYLARVEKPS